MFRNGDIVRIKESYRNANENDLLYRIVNVNEATGRCYIELAENKLPLSPQELVSFDMIQLVRAVPLRVSYNDQRVLTDAAGIEYTALSCVGHFMSQATGEIFCTAKTDDLGNVVAVEPLYQRLNNKLSLVDAYSIDEHNTVYTVSLEDGYLVDVKVCSETGLVYVMQNGDGSTVYRESGYEPTVPDYKYNEEAVITFVKDEHLKRTVLEKPSLSAQIQVAERLVAGPALEVLPYDKEMAQRCEGLAMQGLVDVLTPQEAADLFRKPVKDGTEIYRPSLSDEFGR